jgi:hypothetical protein
MSRVRVSGLVGLGVLAVVLFLVAPEEGRFSQTPTLVLVGVIALLWHLAWTDGVDAGAALAAPAVGATLSTTSPTARTAAASEPSAVPVAESSSDGTAETSQDQDDQEEDLSMLPDPPADWPPPGVEVPMVFRAELVEADIIDLTDVAVADAGRIDLTGADGGRLDLTGTDAGRIDLTPGVVAAPTPTPSSAHDAFEPTGAGDGEPDPWLAFAAAMFRDD